ncbi:MAG TPA: hypothetical protein VN345_01135 [Blastocatellia bacterium]|jgi:hypothetical protein|nr:hypothetical protein [Blastocatellia bacterium]
MTCRRTDRLPQVTGDRKWWNVSITVAISRWVPGYFPQVTALDGLAQHDVTVSDGVPGVSAAAENDVV